MKKFTLMLLAGIVAVTSFAQKPLAKAEKFAKEANELRQTQMQARGVSRSSLASRQKSPRKSLGLVTPPTEAPPETYYTASGKLNVYTGDGWEDGERETIQVIVDGSDIYIAGLAFWVENAWIKGTIDGTTATFPAAQQVDDDESYPEWISGSDDGQTICDVVFNFDQVAGVLECVTTYIGECSAEDGFSVYAYWNQPTFTRDEPAGPELVVLPDGLEILPYAMSYDEGSKGINVAVDGNDVYFQGMSQYLPEAWVKGTKDGNLVTFPAMQYMGDYGNNGSSFFFYNGEATFTYDPDAGTYTAEGLVYGVLADQYYDGKYTNPVLTPVVEKAVMPANPEITGMEENNYGWIVEFNIPLTDVNGDPLVGSKLTYMIYTDTEGTIAPLTFTPATHSKLTENMTEIPYGFTENWDFYATNIYLNDLYSADWTRIGIQSIYRGGGEENKTEIQWFNILPEPEAIEAPEGLETETYLFTASCLEAGKENWEDYSYQVQVGFDGNDVYFSGINSNCAAYWMKGTLSEDGKTVTIPASQYMGRLTIWVYTYDYYITAKDGEDNMIDVVLNYDSESSTFTTAQTVVLNGNRTSWDPYQTFTSVKITKMLEFAATPADPSIDDYKFEGTNYPYINFVIPAKDVDGNDLISSKLFYTVWIDEDGEEKPFVVLADEYRDVTEDWTEIPYDWDDQYDIYRGGSRFYINPKDAIKGWTKYGIQSIYYGGGERHVSNIVWSDGSKTKTVVMAPADLVTETYSFDGFDLDYSANTTRQVEVGFYGENEVYIQGLSEYRPNAWVKGSLEGNTLTIPETYLGTYTESDGEWSENYKITFSGATFTYDGEIGTFYSEDGYVTDDNPDDEIFYDRFKYITLTKLPDYATTPINPDIFNFDYLDVDDSYVLFNIPAVSALDGGTLIKNKLYYQFYYYKDLEVVPLVLTKDLYPELDADMSEIPYGFSKQGLVYMDILYLRQPKQEIDSWYMIGLQSIYYGGGERNTSEIVWWTNPTPDGIQDLKDANDSEAAIYNLAGQCLNKPVKGVNIIDGKKIVK